MVTQQRGAAAPTSGAQDHVPLDTASLDAAVAEVASHVDEWVITAPGDRAEILRRVVRDTVAVAEKWTAAACAAKGYDPDGTEGGEELFGGVGVFIRMAQAFRRSMEDLAQGRQPRYPGPVRHGPDGRLIIQVAPTSRIERVLNGGMTGEVWMQPGVTEAEVQATQAAAYRDPYGHRGVSLVLGAGNVGSLGPRDVLTKLFAEGHVVVLKANPVNDYLVPFWTVAMNELITRGVLRIVTGGAAAGAHLVAHPLIDDVHVTGSDKTFDAIVFGVGEEGARRKAAGEPLVTKPVTGELGCVSPVVIVPGEWSDKDIAYQARHVATMLVNNAGFNCLTPRVIVTHAAWRQRDAFLDALEGVLKSIPTRRAYYPGAAERHAQFLRAHPDAHEIGDASGDRLPWTVVRGVTPSPGDDVCLNVEAFCSLTSECALEADSVAQFVERATAFCNDVVWGTLSATVLAHPRELRDSEVGPAIESAIANLRYGSIGLNLWHAMSFAFATTTWGAYPGHALTDIQSGTGVVGNGFLFASPEKSVVRGPFRATPEPAWFATNTKAGGIMRQLLMLEADPRWLRVPALVWAGVRGK